MLIYLKTEFCEICYTTILKVINLSSIERYHWTLKLTTNLKNLHVHYLYEHKGNQCILSMVRTIINNYPNYDNRGFPLLSNCSITSIWQNQWCMKLVIGWGSNSTESSAHGQSVILRLGFNPNNVLVHGQYFRRIKRKLKYDNQFENSNTNYPLYMCMCTNNKYLKYIIKHISKSE